MAYFIPNLMIFVNIIFVDIIFLFILLFWDQKLQIPLINIDKSNILIFFLNIFLIFFIILIFFLRFSSNFISLQ